MGRAHNKIRRKRRLKKLLKTGGWVLLAALIISAFWFGSTIGPEAPVEGPVEQTVTASASELVEESEALEEQFEAIAAERSPAGEDLDLLRQAIRLQRENNRTHQPTYEDRRRLTRLEERLSHFVAQSLSQESAEAEARAEELRAAGQLEEAAAAFAQAYELQLEINREHSSSRFRSTGRENRLEQMQMVLQIEPLHERSRGLEQEGRRAFADGEWDEARQLLGEARDLQVQVNESARRSRYYDAGRVTRLDNEISSIDIGETAAEIESLRQEASVLSAGNETARAAELLDRALSLQRDINRNHPQSRFASTALSSDLEVELQTARSAEGARQLSEQMDRLRQALAAGGCDTARGEIQGARRLAEQLFERYPRSLYVDSDLRLELDYLSIVDPALESLQEALTEDLLPIPGMDGWRMLRTEVPQQLYQTVMNANPSRNRGPDMPVDSVTWRQAHDFCRRAGWILGRPVQLVTREQFTAALGEWEPADSVELSGGAQEAGGVRTGEPNAHGFYHLVGSVSQWLEPAAGEENGRGWVAGGTVEAEGNLFQPVDRRERSAEIGFRYSVHERPRE